jgi:hypothetical protein
VLIISCCYFSLILYAKESFMECLNSESEGENMGCNQRDNQGKGSKRAKLVWIHRLYIFVESGVVSTRLGRRAGCLNYDDRRRIENKHIHEHSITHSGHTKKTKENGRKEK